MEQQKQSMNIQWYPGHMTKTRRMMEEDLKLVDAVCEILDARIPISSRNPDIDAICGAKPRLVILNRIDMADPVMVKGAKAENRPGVTRGKQWVTVDTGLLLLDTPGILWPRFEDPEVGIRLAYTGAVKDDILDTETLAFHLMQMLWKRYPDAVRARYKIDLPADADGVQLLEAAGRKRGFLISGGEIDLERMAKVLLEEYRSCKLGRFTLEAPDQLAQEETE